MISHWGLPGQHPVRSPVGHTQDPVHGDGLGEAPCPLGQEGVCVKDLSGQLVSLGMEDGCLGPRPDLGRPFQLLHECGWLLGLQMCWI